MSMLYSQNLFPEITSRKTTFKNSKKMSPIKRLRQMTKRLRSKKKRPSSRLKEAMLLFHQL